MTHGLYTPRRRPRPGDGTECALGEYHCTFPECACRASTPSVDKARLLEAERLLGEWLKRAEAHVATITEFKGGYQPFLTRATKDFLK